MEINWNYMYEAMMLLLLLISVLKFWEFRIKRKFHGIEMNDALKIFYTSQITSLFILVYFGLDAQILFYFENLKETVKESDYWSIFSMQLFVFLFVYFIVYYLTYLLYFIVFSIDKLKLDNLNEDKKLPVAVFGFMLAFVSFLAGAIIVKPLLLNWFMSCVTEKAEIF